MRLIDADEMSRIFSHYGNGAHMYDAFDLDEMLNEMPTIDPVRHGEWIPVVDGNQIIWECSECHVKSEAWTDFCPICGSRNIEEMDEEAFEEALEEFRKNPKTYTLDEVEDELLGCGDEQTN